MVVIKTLKGLFISDTNRIVINKNGKFVNVYETFTINGISKTRYYTFPFNIITSFSMNGKEILL